MAVATELANAGHDVTLIGGGAKRSDTPYRFIKAPLVPRERFEKFPKFPPFRSETVWEEAAFLPGFLKAYRPADFDVTLTCSYPFLNWALRRRKSHGRRPAHVFVTQNGDWPARASNSEYRLFGCDGLVCINPDFFEENSASYRCALIPNGVDLARFFPGRSAREIFGLPSGVPLVLMVSALIESKKVGVGIEAVSRIPNAHLVVAGNGPMREELRRMAEQSMPGRFHNFTVTPERMPALYRSADVFLHLSRDESFGNVYVEAMASGVPTVAWDLPRTRWIIGETGYLVSEEDSEKLSEAIQGALYGDLAGEALAERAKRFSWRIIAREYEQFLWQVVEAKRNGGA